jgi:hypothetical protein
LQNFILTKTGLSTIQLQQPLHIHIGIRPFSPDTPVLFKYSEKIIPGRHRNI